MADIPLPDPIQTAKANQQLQETEKWLQRMTSRLQETARNWQKQAKAVLESTRRLSRHTEGEEHLYLSLKRNREAFAKQAKSLEAYNKRMKESRMFAGLTSTAFSKLAIAGGTAWLALKGLNASFAPRLDVGIYSGVSALESLQQAARRAGVSVKQASTLYGQWQRTSARGRFGAIPGASLALPRLQAGTQGLGAETSNRLIMDVLNKLDPAAQARYFKEIQTKGIVEATRNISTLGNVQEVTGLLNGIRLATLDRQHALPKEISAALAVQRSKERIGENVEKITDSLLNTIAPALETFSRYSGGKQLAMLAGAYGLGKWGVPKLFSILGGAARGAGAVGAIGGTPGLAIPYGGALGALTPVAGGAGAAVAGALPVAATVAAGAAIGSTVGYFGIYKPFVKKAIDYSYERGQKLANERHMVKLHQAIAHAEEKKANQLGISVQEWRQKREQKRAELREPQPKAKQTDSLRKMKISQEKFLEQYSLRQAELGVTQQLVETERLLYGYGSRSLDKLNSQLSAQIKNLQERLKLEQTDKTIQGRLKALATETELNQALREQRVLRAGMPREKFIAEMTKLQAQMDVERSRIEALQAGLGFTSYEQTLQLADSLNEKIRQLQKEEERLARVKDRTYQQDIELLSTQSEINRTIAERKTLLREQTAGHLRAVEAMAIGAGKFEKIMITQESNLDKAMRRNLVRPHGLLGLSGTQAASSTIEPFQWGTDTNRNMVNLERYSRDLARQFDLTVPSTVMPIITPPAHHLNVGMEKASNLSGALNEAGKALNKVGTYLQTQGAKQADRQDDRIDSMDYEVPPIRNAHSLTG